MASFADLPAEVLCLVASHLSHTDKDSHDQFIGKAFCCLRLSCRAVQTKTQYAFERAAFSTVAVRLDAKSLKKLRDVANHPRLGKQIHKLVFSKAQHPVYDISPAKTARRGMYNPGQEYRGYGIIELPKDGYDGVYPNDGLMLPQRVRRGLQSCLGSVMSNTPNLRDVFIKPGFMASFWLDTPSRQEQLDERAAQVQKMQSTESLDVEADVDEATMRALDNEDYDVDVDDDPSPLETYIYPDHLLHLVVSAAHFNSISLSSITYNDNKSACVRARTIVELTPALRSLQHLNLSIGAANANMLYRRDGTSLHSLETSSEPAVASLGTALSSMSELRTLKIAFDMTYFEDDRWPNITSTLRGISDAHLPHLTSFSIMLAAFAANDLCDFLRAHQATLQELHIAGTYLPDEDDWQPILKLMYNDMPNLETLVCQGDGRRSGGNIAWQRGRRLLHCERGPGRDTRRVGRGN